MFAHHLAKHALNAKMITFAVHTRLSVAEAASLLQKMPPGEWPHPSLIAIGFMAK